MEGGGFNKQREFTYEACLGRRLQDEWIPTRARHILKVYKAVLTGFGCVYPCGVLSPTLPSQGRVFGAAFGSRKGKGRPHSKDRRGREGPLGAWGQLKGQLAITVFLMTSPINTRKQYIEPRFVGFVDFHPVNAPTMAVSSYQNKRSLNIKLGRNEDNTVYFCISILRMQ